MAALSIVALVGNPAAAVPDATSIRPDAIVDLNTAVGLELVKGQWRYHNAGIVEVDHHAPGPDLKPSGPPNRTHDIAPQAGAGDFDDSGWGVLNPGTLDARRSTGRLCFNWYRINVTIPDMIAAFQTTGSTAVFEIVVDDYAEVWVDGNLPQMIGTVGGPVISGWNAPNRLVVGRNVKPGQQIQLAVFAANGPLSQPPGNFIWIRSATLDFYRPERISPVKVVPVEIARLDPALDEIVPRHARLEKLADGFGFTEGPVWHPDGYLLFSDPNNNTIYRWSPDGQISVFRVKSGYSGTDIGEYGQPGSNGLALDRDGRLTICEHGNRRISRLERNGQLTIIADRYAGKRLNSPNDLVYRSDGALFFTDPAFGLPKWDKDPRREQPHLGVYCLTNGTPKLICDDLRGPNGIALSPDEKQLYVGNWDEKKKVVMRYDLGSDGTLSNGRVFFDLTAAPRAEAIDGVKVDQRGNVYVSGPGGLWIVSPAGKALGTLKGPELAANFAWGDADGRTLYLTARSGLYRIRLSVPGARPF
jgi:gluconolactonase